MIPSADGAPYNADIHHDLEHQAMRNEFANTTNKDESYEGGNNSRQEKIDRLLDRVLNATNADGDTTIKAGDNSN